MEREEAIKKIAELKINNLNKDERAGSLIGWWNIDKEDKEFKSLPQELQKEMTENDEYENPENKKYNPLILKALVHEFKGVRNEYIERELRKLTKNEIQVVGEIENFEKCPCCKYRTLEEKNISDICEVCYWEDDGSEELNIESLANNMSLEEAQENFKKIGACEKELIQYTEKEPELKYEK
jgi:excinuclease UvrABC ATPase subunit